MELLYSFSLVCCTIDWVSVLMASFTEPWLTVSGCVPRAWTIGCFSGCFYATVRFANGFGQAKQATRARLRDSFSLAEPLPNLESDSLKLPSVTVPSKRTTRQSSTPIVSLLCTGKKTVTHDTLDRKVRGREPVKLLSQLFSPVPHSIWSE